MKPVHILLIEDNEGDILLTTEALEESKVLNKVSILKDGSEAITFFKNVKFKNELPDLILLDVNLPKKNGHDVLHFIKNEEHLKHLPVIMLSTSSADKDILSAYKNYANCYITKPVEVADFMNAIIKIEDFWINIVTTPSL